ncbi:hypothetical protein AOLI_G00201780 [Acnodon oligacanthus]
MPGKRIFPCVRESLILLIIIHELDGGSCARGPAELHAEAPAPAAPWGLAVTLHLRTHEETACPEPSRAPR